MNKLVLTQLGLVTAGIICIFICFFLTVAEYHPFQTSTEVKTNTIIVESSVGDCSSSDESSTNECLSWKWNYAMGILVIISGFVTLGIITLREFLLRELISQYVRQVRLTMYSVSFLAVVFAITGLIWLISCQDNFIVELLPICLMLIAGVLIMLSGLVLEDIIAKSRGETLLN